MFLLRLRLHFYERYYIHSTFFYSICISFSKWTGLYFLIDSISLKNDEMKFMKCIKLFVGYNFRHPNVLRNTICFMLPFLVRTVRLVLESDTKIMVLKNSNFSSKGW